MAIITKDFDSYSFYYASNTNPGGVTNVYSSMNLNNGHDVVAYIGFFDTTPLPDNSYTNNIITIHFPISRFNDFIGILRYEKPLRIQFDTSKLEGHIQTKNPELVGEQEGV
jgi:hypothetical protein